jgi:hypothetical protein
MDFPQVIKTEVQKTEDVLNLCGTTHSCSVTGGKTGTDEDITARQHLRDNLFKSKHSFLHSVPRYEEEQEESTTA